MCVCVREKKRNNRERNGGQRQTEGDQYFTTRKALRLWRSFTCCVSRLSFMPKKKKPHSFRYYLSPMGKYKPVPTRKMLGTEHLPGLLYYIKVNSRVLLHGKGVTIFQPFNDSNLLFCYVIE